jgi:hypothetical protein
MPRWFSSAVSLLLLLLQSWQSFYIQPKPDWSRMPKILHQNANLDNDKLLAGLLVVLSTSARLDA